MKFGIRKPNVKKSIKARTTGRAKRAFKKSINPLYREKGAGIINNPGKSLYNKVYNKTTISAVPKLKSKYPISEESFQNYYHKVFKVNESTEELELDNDLINKQLKNLKISRILYLVLGIILLFKPFGWFSYIALIFCIIMFIVSNSYYKNLKSLKDIQ